MAIATTADIDDVLVGMSILVEFHDGSAKRAENVSERHWHKGAKFALVMAMSMLRGEFDPIGLGTFQDHQAQSVDELGKEA